MIAVTPRVGHAPPLVGHRPPAGSGQDFAGLLDSRPGTEAAASSFDGRGMFGAHRAVDASAARTPPSRGALNAAGGVTESSGTTPPERAPLPSNVAVVPGQNPLDPSTIRKDDAKSAPARGRTATRASFAPNGELRAISEEAEGEVGPVRTAPAVARRLPVRTTPQAVLSVTGTDDALHIVVRGGEESAELHRGAQAIAAEFGMEIAEFRLDGQAGNHQWVISRGGGRGHRSR